MGEFEDEMVGRRDGEYEEMKGNKDEWTTDLDLSVIRPLREMTDAESSIEESVGDYHNHNQYKE